MMQQTDINNNSVHGRLITLAIHTYGQAQALKALLEREGVNVVLQNVNLEQPVVSAGIRVRINENDLPLALRIIENTDIFAQPSAISPENDDSRQSRRIIVPVDFSPHSIKACDIAFQLADRSGASVILLNSFITPSDAAEQQLNDTLNFGSVDSEASVLLAQEAKGMLDALALDIRNKIKTGSLPAVKFTTTVLKGIPEEVIVEYAKDCHPELIVMGTRAADKKERELIGSVTAEVLDSARFPILAIPEMVEMNNAGDIRHVLLFCNLDQDDLLAVDALYRFFKFENLNVGLVWLPSKKQRGRNMQKAQQMLKDYCVSHYPRFCFETRVFNMPSIMQDFKAVEQECHIDLIAMPNRKKSVFARLFNPSLAHRLLFHADIPMMVIPV